MKPMTNKVEREILALRLDLMLAHEQVSRALRYRMDGMLERAKVRRETLSKALKQALAPYMAFEKAPEIDRSKGYITKKDNAAMETHYVVERCLETLNENELDDPCLLDEVRETEEWNGIEGAI